MTTRLEATLAVVRAVAERADPTEAMSVGRLASELRLGLSAASRICTELESARLLERAGGYGSYRLGRGAIELSGRAAAPFAGSIRYALTAIAQQTGETVVLAAGVGDRMRVVAVVDSAWTLHVPASPGELLANDGGIARASGTAEPCESVRGPRVEIAEPVLGPSGQLLGVLAVLLPANRLEKNGPRARRAVAAARRSIERGLSDEPAATPTPSIRGHGESAPSALEATIGILNHLAGTSDTVAAIAVATGLRSDRTARLLACCVRAGVLVAEPHGRFSIGWAMHGWYRAATSPTLLERGTALVAATAERTGSCAFVTVLVGMRSLTLIEQLRPLAEGLRMSPWIGRRHPLIGSDGGPALVVDFTDAEITALFPARHSTRELEVLLDRVRRVARRGVISMEAFDDAGILSISASVRDASGAVAAAACIVGTTDHVRAHRAEFEQETRRLAEDLSAELGYSRPMTAPTASVSHR